MSKIDIGRSRRETTRETVVISSCVWGYHVYKDRRKTRVGEKLACIRESTNIEDRCAVAVVENQDHVDAIESDRLPCGFGNKLSCRRLKYFSIDISAQRFCPTWRPAKEIYGIIIFGLVQIFVDLIFDTQSLYEN